MDRAVLAVVYDEGSAKPHEIVTACRPNCDMLFIWDEARGADRSILQLLQMLAPVVTWSEERGDAFTEELAAHGVTGIITFSDRAMSLTAQLGERLGFPYHSEKLVRALTDKRTQRRALAEGGVVVPRSARARTADQLRSALETVGLPAVLKPATGQSSRNTFRIETMADWDTYAATALQIESDVIVEEMLVGDQSVAGEHWGDYVSVESVVVDGAVIWAGVTGKFPLEFPFRENGGIFPSTLDGDWERDVIGEAARAATALGIRNGVCHIEVKLTAAGPRVIEVNGRLGGFMNALVQRATGFSLLDAAIRIAVGRRVPVEPLTCGCVVFVRTVQPPQSATRLEAMTGVPAVRAMHGIDRVQQTRKDGSTLDWRAGTGEAVAVVQGTASSHEAVLTLAGDMLTNLAIVYA
jgi:hypothetical protein